MLQGAPRERRARLVTLLRTSPVFFRLARSVTGRKGSNGSNEAQ